MRGRARHHRRSKMPVRDVKPVSIDTGDDSPMTEKDSDYMKTPKVWSRELRNRFIISSGKRSLRFNNSDGSRTRNLRSCRMSVLSRSAHYSLSQSDDDEDDDDDDDERMFSSRKLRPCQLRMRHSVRMTSQDSGGRMGHSRSNPSSSQVEDGIRRSTRVRKLKYDNYSDSWIVGSQTLRGYPSYGGASYPTSVKTEVKQEESGVEEIEDEEEEEGGGTETVGENGEVKMRSESGSKQTEMPKQKPQVKKKKEDTREDEPVEGSSEAGEEGDVEETYQDMYARVKRRRTQSHNKSECSTDSDSMSEEEQPRRRRQRSRAETKYHLRQTKPTVDRFQAAAEPDKRSSGHVLREVLTSVRKRRRRSSTSSSDTSSSDERFDRKKAKAKSRNRVELCGGGSGETGNGGGGPGGKTGSLLADVRPVVLDSSIRFTDVGGLERHVTCLKEMVVFPMLYTEVFARFGVTPPKGVLFHGPPGTGKTLVARALANECSLGERKVSFFMRKGADCLSKWVGESERQLRLLFEEAKQARPSIIFFDELDGLAPVRSSRQDQIHASIVCTLLALMDGLDNRGDIVVIGATNRIDSIDPALRRPGRFDRELHFPLPGVKERLEILNIHTREWGDQEVLTRMAELSAGYCGSDLKALCTEAVLQALKRVYPQIYTSDQKLLLNPDRVKVLKEDFEKASRGIVPASRRAAPTLGRKLPVYLEPLLVPKLNNLLKHVLRVFPAASNKEGFSGQMVRSPRLLLVGRTKETSLLIAGLLYKLEKCQVHSLGLEALYSDTSTSPEEKITKVFKELPHSLAAVLWFGDINMWWNCIADSAKAVFMSLVSLLDPALPVLFIATSASSEIPLDLQSLFSQYRGEVHQVGTPTLEQREAFFRPLFRVRALRPPPPPKPKKEELEPLAVAPPPPPPKLSQDQLNKLYHEEENTLRELRIFLRQICAKLARNKQFYMFSKPVDIAEVPDYLQIIKEPMDLETMMTKIDLHKYTCAQDFLNDVDLLCRNALEYNPDRDPADKLIRHRACYLRDTAYALIKAEMDSDFEDNCRSIRELRRQREAEPAEERFAREFFPNDQLPGTSEEAEKAEVKKVEVKKEAEELTDAGEKTEVVTPNNSAMDSSTATTVGSAPSIEVKKRKRKQAWSRGCVAKRTSKPKTTPTPPSDLSKSAETSIMTNGIGGPSEEDEDSKTEATDKTSTPVVPENSETPDQTPKKTGDVLEVDRVGLSELVTDTVAATEGRCSLDALIDLYSILRRIINSYSRKWDRKNLVPELKKELVRFAEEYSQDDEEEVRVEEEEMLDDTDAVANLDLSES